MRKYRIIARIDVKNEFVIKGIHLEGLRKLGNPNAFASEYYRQGIDEIIFMDAVASLYDRNSLFPIIEKACQDVFVPITLGGGIRTLNDFQASLRVGADKVALNTKAIKTPAIISEASEVFGSQCVVVSIEAKRKPAGYEAYIDNGREETGKDVLQWAKEAQELGAGELLVTSVDQEGTQKGFDTELLKQVLEVVDIPVIASGGAGSVQHLVDLFEACPTLSGVAVASLFHYKKVSIVDLKQSLKERGLSIR